VQWVGSRQAVLSGLGALGRRLLHAMSSSNTSALFVEPFMKGIGVQCSNHSLRHGEGNRSVQLAATCNCTCQHNRHCRGSWQVVASVQLTTVLDVGMYPALSDLHQYFPVGWVWKGPVRAASALLPPPR
jgi:hypothetical protein